MNEWDAPDMPPSRLVLAAQALLDRFAGWADRQRAWSGSLLAVHGMAGHVVLTWLFSRVLPSPFYYFAWVPACGFVGLLWGVMSAIWMRPPRG